MIPLSALHNHHELYNLRHDLDDFEPILKEIHYHLFFYSEDKKKIAEMQEKGLKLLSNMLKTLNAPIRSIGVSKLIQMEKAIQTLEKYAKEGEVKERVVPIYSSEWTELLQYKAFIQAMRLLNKITGDFGATQTILDNLLKTIELGKLCQAISDTHADTLVLSIGSAGKDREQQCPLFVTNIGEKEKMRVDVLNADPSLDFEGFYDPLSSKTVHVSGYKAAVDSLSRYLDASDELTKALEATLYYLLEKTDKKLIVLYHAAPVLSSLFYKMGHRFSDKIGSQLEIVGSYFYDCPVVLYDPILFQQDPKTFESYLQGAWKLWKDSPRLEDGRYDISSENLRKWQTLCQHHHIGKLFRNLHSIKDEEIFKKTRKPKPG